MIDLSHLLVGKPLFNGASLKVTGISIDSRTIKQGECFIALRGENFDGHHYVKEALEKGAKYAVVAQELKGIAAERLIVVDSTLSALRLLARAHRARFNIPMVALTGSCGKTTVKEMISHMLTLPHLATTGNLNNHLGVPLMLLRLTKEHKAAIFELGANHLGEIIRNVRLVSPHYSMITNISEAHVGEFGGIDNIEVAKGEIFEGLESSGTFIVNLDDERVQRQAYRHKNAKITYSCQTDKAFLFASDIVLNKTNESYFKVNIGGKCYPVALKLAGLHNVQNALAALAVINALGERLDLAIERLASFQGVPGRLMRVPISSKQTVLDDTYNANVSSVLAGIKVLAMEQGEKILVLGELAEAGDSLEQHKKAILDCLLEHHIDRLYSVGEIKAKFSKPSEMNYHHFKSKEELVSAIPKEIASHQAILVKGSRCAKMEEVVELLKKQSGGQHA